MTKVYEATIRVYAPEGLNDDQLRAWGDEMDDFAQELIDNTLEISGAGCHIEVHGPNPAVLQEA